LMKDSQRQPEVAGCLRDTRPVGWGTATEVAMEVELGGCLTRLTEAAMREPFPKQHSLTVVEEDD
jgi:hypothetical protein